MPSEDEALHFGSFRGPPVEMTKAQILIRIGLSHRSENLAVNRKLTLLKKVTYELGRLLSPLHRYRWIIYTFAKIGDHLLGQNLGSRLRIHHFDAGLMPG